MQRLAAILCITLAAASGAASGASAPGQQPSNSSTTGTGSAEAPIGHRQPTMSDLPRKLRRREKSGQLGEPKIKTFNDIPRICSGC